MIMLTDIRLRPSLMNNQTERKQIITRGIGGHLILIWFEILRKESPDGKNSGMGGMRFENLLQDFVNVTNASPGNSAPTRQVTRGNLRRELIGSNSLTWRSFLRGLRVIRVDRFDFTCELKWGTGKKTMHSIVVDFNQDNALSFQKQRKQTNVFDKDVNDYRIRPSWLVIHCALGVLDSNIDKLWLKEKPIVTVNSVLSDLEGAMRTTTGSGGHLVRMFYQILSDMDMSTDRFEYLLGAFVRANKNIYGEGSATKQLSSGNLRRELIGGEAITWRSFIRGLLILRVKELSVNLRLHTTDGKSLIHCMVINLRQSHMSEEESDLTPEDLSD